MTEYSLPVRYAIVDVGALQTLIATLYGWTNVRCQLIKGTMRDVYEVWSDQQHAILCLYRSEERTHSEIDAELTVMQYLHHQGLSIPLPVTLRDGERLFLLRQPEGMRHGAMITFMAGKPIGRQFDSAVGSQIGRALAVMHRALNTLTGAMDRPVLDFSTALTSALTAFAYAAPHRSDDLLRLHSMGETLLRRLTLNQNNAAYGLMHGDIIPSNILQNGDRLVLLDFDLCAYGWQVYDVASMLVEIAYWGMDAAVAEAVLHGYNAECAFTDAERAMLPTLQGIRGILSLGTPARHIDTWGRGYFSDTIIDKQLALIEQVMS